ncbi:MAG: hypothetical protein QOI34_852 [Verrucomicrobiota bacterium]|jgi:hypothetical protein
MKHLIIFLVAILIGPSLALANLGDDDDAIERVYGNLVQRHLLDDGTVTTLYHKDRYLYFVVFNKGRSVLEKYSRTDGHELSRKEIARFLKANSARGTWTQRETPKGGGFERSDHKAEATSSEIDGRPAFVIKALNKK